MVMSMLIFDTEVYPNAFLIAVKNIYTGNTYSVWGHEPDARGKVATLMTSGHTFVGFNSLRYDDMIINAFIAGYNEAELHKLSHRIIKGNLNQWTFFRELGGRKINYDHIDLIEVAPSFVSLKVYGARMHMPWLESLPYHFDSMLDAEQMTHLLEYCINDLDTTEALYNQLKPAIKLREEMGAVYLTDMRSKSDTQMAETAFVRRLNLGSQKTPVPRTIKYVAPDFITYRDPGLQDLLEKIKTHTYEMNRGTGHVILPDFLKEIIEVYGGSYQPGVGGLHSTHDKKVCHLAGDDELVEIDAASYYPSIIIKSTVMPERLGKRFIDEYSSIYHKRLKAKAEGNKSEDDVLKISLNGTFGKTASRWSPIYAPEIMLYTTLTGQLTLLMLIEWLALAGVKTLSANTDGIVAKYPQDKKDLVEHVVSAFGKMSEFVFEYTNYRALAMANCNNYIAVKTDRSTKRKGIYAQLSLKKNPTAEVCSNAVAEWLARGTSFEETIENSDFVDFLSARNVKGGGTQEGKYLGSPVRWYYTTKNLPPITYSGNGNKVAKTDGGRACMLVEDKVTHPVDLDYNWYLEECNKIAERLGCGEYL